MNYRQQLETVSSGYDAQLADLDNRIVGAEQHLGALREARDSIAAVKPLIDAELAAQPEQPELPLPAPEPEVFDCEVLDNVVSFPTADPR